MTYKVALVGADTVIGREIAQVLHERGFPLDELVPLASAKGAGEPLEMGERELAIRLASADSIAGCHIVIFAGEADSSQRFVDSAVSAGAVVIDTTGAFIDDDDVAVVIPELGVEAVTKLDPERRILASPRGPAVVAAVALGPLAQEAGLRRVVTTALMAVSGEGKPGLDELGEQVTALFGQRDIEPRVFPRRIAFNCVPQVGRFDAMGHTDAEEDTGVILERTLGLPRHHTSATCAYVPVFNGDSISVIAELDRPMSAERARELLRDAKGVMLIDEPSGGKYPTPADAEGSEAILVGRVREEPAFENGLGLWCTADNLRKGAASGAVQLAEIVVRDLLAE